MPVPPLPRMSGWAEVPSEFQVPPVIVKTPVPPLPTRKPRDATVPALIVPPVRVLFAPRTEKRVMLNVPEVLIVVPPAVMRPVVAVVVIDPVAPVPVTDWLAVRVKPPVLSRVAPSPRKKPEEAPRRLEGTSSLPAEIVVAPA